MSIHEDISSFMYSWLDARSGVGIISPTALAAATQSSYEAGEIEPHIAYTSLEHFKQIARRVLAGRYDDHDENPAYQEQGTLFPGLLQDRYPIPRGRGQEPQYKLRSLLTAHERAWNVEVLRKSAKARQAHADALEAEGMEPPEKVAS